MQSSAASDYLNGHMGIVRVKNRKSIELAEIEESRFQLNLDISLTEVGVPRMRISILWKKGRNIRSIT